LDSAKPFCQGELGDQAVAPSLGVDLTPVDARDASEIERAITAFARSGNAGLIVTASPVTLRHRDLIVTLAARYSVGWTRDRPRCSELL
jgi:hypothetical protein